jgi:hypothetical protein
MNNWWLQGERYARLARDLKEVWRSFKYDIVLPKDNGWIYEAADNAAAEINERRKIVMWTNFPAGRGFEVEKDGWQWKAWDDNGNLYWLNMNSKRWICMSGTDADLPADEYGNVNQGQNFTHYGQGYFVFETLDGDDDFLDDDFLDDDFLDDDFFMSKGS